MQNATYHVNGTYAGLYDSFKTLDANLYPQYGQDYSSNGNQVTFAIVFGVLFSGVTGKQIAISSFLTCHIKYKINQF